MRIWRLRWWWVVSGGVSAFAAGAAHGWLRVALAANAVWLFWPIQTRERARR